MNENEYEELSEEELQRRREIRRRKLAARERRRKKRRQEAIIRCSILLIIVILLIVGIVKGISGIWKHFHNNKKENDKVSEQVMEPTTETPTTEEFKVDESILAQEMPADRDTALAMIKEQADAEEDTDLQNIYDNAAVYSDRVLKNLAINTELKDYTTDYLTKVSIAYDGDFTMDISTTDVPLLMQYDEQWGYADYGSNLLAYDGSAPTCVSMVYTYLKQDGSQNPIKVGDYFMSMGYVDEDDKTSWEAMTQGVKGLGLEADELSVNEGNMKAALDEGRVIICSVGSGDFTKETEHFIVIRGYDDYKFYVNDPSSNARSQIAWPFERLSSQINNMWAFNVSSSTDSSGSLDSAEDGTDDNTIDATDSGDNATGDNETDSITGNSNDTNNNADEN
jgi:hypothetical protein